MKSAVLPLSIVLFCAAAVADEQRAREFIANDEWHPFSETASGAKVFTKGAVRLRPNRLQVWFKVEFNQPKECGSSGNVFMRSPLEDMLCNQKRSDELGQSLNLLDIDCAAGKTRVIETVEYNFAGDVTHSADLSDAKWGRIIPDTIGADLYSSMCDAGRRFDG